MPLAGKPRCIEDVGTGAWEQVEYVTDVRRRVRAVRDHWRYTPQSSTR